MHKLQRYMYDPRRRWLREQVGCGVWGGARGRRMPLFGGLTGYMCAFFGAHTFYYIFAAYLCLGRVGQGGR